MTNKNVWNESDLGPVLDLDLIAILSVTEGALALALNEMSQPGHQPAPPS